MIVGYYHQIFFGGGTYYKLSKKDNEDKYKFEYCHSAIPNYIPEAENYIQKYDSLKIKDERFQEKIVIIYLELNSEIKRIIDILNTVNWAWISEKEYTSNELDDVCWEFYNEADNYSTHYLVKGYSVYPKEIEEIYNIFNKMKEKFFKQRRKIMEEWISLNEFMKRNKIGYNVALKMLYNKEVEYLKTDGGHYKVKVGGNSVSREMYEQEREKRIQAETKLQMLKDFINNLIESKN